MRNLLLVIAFPDGEPYLDSEMDDDPELVDMVADGIVQMLNDDRRRNCEETRRPDYYKPLTLNAIPGPQWVDDEGLSILMQAIRLVQDVQKPLRAVRAELDRCIAVAPNDEARTAYEWIETFLDRGPVSQKETT